MKEARDFQEGPQRPAHKVKAELLEPQFPGGSTRTWQAAWLKPVSSSTGNLDRVTLNRRLLEPDRNER